MLLYQSTSQPELCLPVASKICRFSLSGNVGLQPEKNIPISFAVQETDLIQINRKLETRV